MTFSPDAALHGVPSYYSWASGEADGQNPVPQKNNQGEWFRAMTAWGQVYIPVEGSPASNTRCQIRNMESKLLLKNGKWVVVQSNQPQGAAFVEDFSNNNSMDAGVRDESTNGGGISVIVGVGPWAGHNFHFWPLGYRAEVDVDSVTGVFTTCEARLIVDDPNKLDDRSMCKNVLQMGADWWLNLTIGWLPDWSANSGIGNCRTKWITMEWQSFSFCSLSPSQILLNPPISTTLISEDEFPVQKLNIFPNPTTDLIMIDLQEMLNFQDFSISVIDSQGKLRFQQPMKEDKMEINLSCLPKGLYLVQVKSSNDVLTGKVVKE